MSCLPCRPDRIGRKWQRHERGGVQGLRARARWAALIGWIFYSYKLKYSTVERGCLRPTDLEGLGRVGARLSLAMIHKRAAILRAFVCWSAHRLSGRCYGAPSRCQIPVAFDGTLARTMPDLRLHTLPCANSAKPAMMRSMSLSAGGAEAEAHAVCARTLTFLQWSSSRGCTTC